MKDTLYYFQLLRPLPETVNRTDDGMPIIKKCGIDKVELSNFITLTNLNQTKQWDISIVLCFEYDCVIDCIWKNPFKYLPKFSKLKAITTPDFSIYSEMDRPTIYNNTYRNRWIGCWYQSQGLKVIPTVSWANEDTYDICFSGLEKGCIVCISTIGCMKKKENFMKGFNEMIKRLDPSLIIIKGRKIPDLKGNIVWVPFEGTFNISKKGGK